ncbi:leucyl/phenylalanyl-tRNA--protein transferase [Pedobacter rhizosphaerae]|uniref:Leucyl/phenylalanyl-tRNA--protein transferase n=1 Tax=Pedobacter rhizosphaerae TaxID=390241 RepID=A0A1H9QK30_9SPHI|nr:leucyl/phenylalanyl-tRNA--protein transferase [Pedobacter rhizosphaerae]SER60941.1 leucyl/phenylalanyl-tRNA--protein transferase [Pedobacter rhizosphaerae]
MQLSSRLLSIFFPGNAKHKAQRKLQQILFFALSKVSRSKGNALLWANSQFELSPHALVSAFTQGYVVFPNMRNHKIVEWLDPEVRGILPIDHFKMQEGLFKLLKKERAREVKEFDIKIDENFEATIRACAEPRDLKAITWLSEEYINSTIQLHKMGIAHSVEAYKNGKLVGGVVGVAINGYFMSLSLFHTVNNAGKVAFYYLMLKLKADGYKLHDLGMPNPWIQQFGMKSLPKKDFKEALLRAITSPLAFTHEVPVLELLSFV